MINGKTLGLHKLGMTEVTRIERNLSVESLIEDSIRLHESHLGMKGAVMVDTGRYTGRSPKDKYFVEENYSKDNLWWGSVNQKVEKKVFEKLYKRIIKYYNNADDNPFV